MALATVAHTFLIHNDSPVPDQLTHFQGAAMDITLNLPSGQSFDGGEIMVMELRDIRETGDDGLLALWSATMGSGTSLTAQFTGDDFRQPVSNGSQDYWLTCYNRVGTSPPNPVWTCRVDLIASYASPFAIVPNNAHNGFLDLASANLLYAQTAALGDMAYQGSDNITVYGGNLSSVRFNGCAVADTLYFDAGATIYLGTGADANIRTALGLGSLATLSMVPTSQGGLNANNSAASGIPVFASGVATVTTPTGTGAPVRATSPTLVTPVLGAATGTTLALTNSDNSFNAQLILKNTSNTAQALTGVTINDSAGATAGLMQYINSVYITSSLRDTMIFGSFGNNKLGFVADTGGSNTPDIYFQSGTNKILQFTGSTQLATFSSAVKLGVFTVGTLPTGANGCTAFVTDANATTFASAVAAGGSNKVPVYADGTTWRIG